MMYTMELQVDKKVVSKGTDIACSETKVTWSGTRGALRKALRVDASLEQTEWEAAVAGIRSRTLVTSLTPTQNCCCKGKNNNWKTKKIRISRMCSWQQKYSIPRRHQVKFSKNGNTFIHIFSGNPALEAFATSTLLENSIPFHYYNQATQRNIERVTLITW